jgi:DNA-binding NarL/FixJ family response regulator
VAAGETDREIARSLNTSVDRVKRAVRSSLMRLGARNRTEAAVRALLAGLVSPEGCRWFIAGS